MTTNFRLNRKILVAALFVQLFCLSSQAQKVNDSTTPLHLMQPAYDTPYGKPEVKSIIEVLDRIYNYLDQTTPMVLINKETQAEVTDYSKIDEKTIFKPGDFRLISYEWGVTYAGMLLASEVTGDPKYAAYTKNRLKFLSDIQPFFVKLEEKQPGVQHAMLRVLHPHALDDCGAMSAAMIKTQQLNFDGDLNPMINTFMDFISNKEFRFADGTLARNRPQPNSMWLDDLFMSVPALAQMGKYTGEKKYFDDAVKQVLQFSDRMFNDEKGLFMHGWIQGMNEHPQFHWARANGWAVMTMVELLEVLPENHEGRAKVLDLLRKHIRGLANYQSARGLWHQLIDRNDSYLETSATAIYTYSIARAINRGYVDAKVYAPMVCLAWNAVASMVNEKGQVEGTCVGTGMGFDPAFYYYRPISVYAAHGYGPVLLAGAEMIQLVKTHKIEINDSSLQLYEDSGNSVKSMNFDFGSSSAKEGFETVTEKSLYQAAKGYGLIPSGEIISGKTKQKDPLTGDFLSSKKPFYFAVDLPEGHYQVTLTLGGSPEGSSTTVKAESRRLMLENVKTGKGETIRKTIVVDVRSPKINDTEHIRLKDRELPYLNWDNKLTLEFNGDQPCVAGIEIKRADELPTVFLAGNSTVVDQEYEPWASWGQMFPNFLKPEIVVANYAESGETLLAFKREKRLQKLLSQMKAGDYLFMEFAHNDQKPGGNHLDAFTTYKDELKYYISEARKKGGKPVLVTSTNRRSFDENGKIINTLEGFPEAMRQTAKEENVPLIDLNAMSKLFYEAMGSENSKKAFVHYPANTYPGQDKPLADNTHFNPYGAFELAKCVADGVRQNIPELAKFLIDGLPVFNPSLPDPVNEFRWYESPSVNLIKPDGN
ncbi:MAG TPA: glycoside hydrolase family 88 protein [Prolixibacteraceae bacterium]|nr:glycoside hydrolase family 88 protein [Prolixibacteraceae bacterium]